MVTRKFSKFLRLVILALFLAAAFVPATSASAHALLIRSIPAADAQLKTSPAHIDLYFSEPVEPSLSDIAVYNSSGARVDDQRPRVDPADFTHLSNSLPVLKDGAYLITWKVISRSDGHLTGGAFLIYIGNVPANAGLQLHQPGPEPAVLPGQVIDKALLYLAVAILTGGLVFEILALHPVLGQMGLAAEDLAHLSRLFRRWIGLGLILLGLSGLFGIMVEAAAFEGQPFVLPWNSQVLVVLTGTQYGVLVLVRLAALFGLAGLLVPTGRRWRVFASLPLLVLVGLSVSLGAHADALANFWMVSADLLHLTAASIWIGGLGLFLASLLWARRLQPEKRTGLAAGLIVRFSTLAVASLGVLALSGVYEALTDVGSLNNLFHTAYGQVLIAKVFLALLMVGLGGYNHFVVRPQLSRETHTNAQVLRTFVHFRRLLILETALGAALLAREASG